jgi:hypothetical protein
MTYEELTTALAEKLGIRGLVRENGVCSLDIDGMTVSLVHAPNADALVLHGILGDSPASAEGRFGAMLLRANHLFRGTDGATLSQDPASKTYALQRQFPLAVLDADSLAAELGRFVDSLERWRNAIAQFRPVEEEASKLAAEDVPPPPYSFGPGGFISV